MSAKKVIDKSKLRQCNRCAEYFDPKTIDGAVHLAACRMHNGYKNYETWVTALWLDNDEGSYHYWREKRDEVKAHTHNQFSAENAIGILAKMLRDEVREPIENTVKGLGADLMGAAFDEVDWYEIAENIMSKK